VRERWKKYENAWKGRYEINARWMKANIIDENKEEAWKMKEK
jgi:hypothetical protein